MPDRSDRTSSGIADAYRAPPRARAGSGPAAGARTGPAAHGATDHRLSPARRRPLPGVHGFEVSLTESRDGYWTERRTRAMGSTAQRGAR